MKAAIICGAGILSGKEMMALELGQGLRDAGHEVSFVTSLWGDGRFRSCLDELGFKKACMRLGFISATLNLECMRMTADQLIRLPWLWRDYAGVLGEERPEQVIHTNWHHLLVLWPFLSPCQDWFWLHEVIPDRPQYRFVFQRLAGRLRGFIPVSDAVKESLLKIGIAHHQIHVVHNGLSDPLAGGEPAVSAWPEIRLGIVGQVGDWKGHSDLLEAFSSNAGSFPYAELHVFGDDNSEFARHLKERARELKLEKRIVWHGFVGDRKRIYSILDACIVPSRTPDPLPTVAIEAAFFGLPVIASRIGGLPEIVEDDVTGLLFKAGDVADLSSSLKRLMADSDLRRRMGSAARDRALKRLCRKRFVADFVSLLNRAGGLLQPGPASES